MAASSFSPLYFKPQLNRLRHASNVVMLHKRERTQLPGSCINIGVTFRHHLYTCPHKQHNFVPGGNVGIPPFCDLTSRAVHFGQASKSSKARRLCQVRREDAGGALSGESILLNEQTLERELQFAIQEENYAQAAKIRDSLRLLQEDSKASVLAANARFYNAFRNGDLASMQALWSKGEHVCAVHPGVSGISGHDLVMGSWEFVWADYEFPLEIEIKDVQVHVRGDVGYVTCIEMVKSKGSNWGRHFATNVFERVDDQWFICIHHASYVDM